jgi:hypothetical protein
MKLLISPTDEKEAAEAIAGGADIIDVKNPKEGSLGASFPWVIRQIRAITPSNVELSCTLGDASNHSGAMALAALGAATTGVNYIKTGLQGVTTKEDALIIMTKIARAIRDHDSSISVVVVGYADSERVDSVDPMEIPEIAHEAKLDIAMIDTAVKDGKSILEFLTRDQLLGFVEKSHRYGMAAAIAGSLSKEDLPMISTLGTDVVGLRGAACTDKDRVNGRLNREMVRELAEIINKSRPIQITPKN